MLLKLKNKYQMKKYVIAILDIGKTHKKILRFYAKACISDRGLTQSFALELMPSGIKVNSVCPGNFFDGLLWSDPENGLFVQYLRAGKVPGAKNLNDVKRFYEAQVPAGRGCTPLDVIRAVYYIIKQEYETGQAVPVTGGQNMLS